MELTNHHPMLELRLARDLRRSIKRGHAWVYRQALQRAPKASPGTPARLFDQSGKQEIGCGYYDPGSPIALRVCSTSPGQSLDDAWAVAQMHRALHLRRCLFDRQTTAFRLFNGEGDGLPGLVCDVYAGLAVLQLDGEGAAGFWQVQGVANWLAEHANVQQVYLKGSPRHGAPSRALVGEVPDDPVPFLENSLHFTADPLQGQKTGFYLDQRDNRARIRGLAHGVDVLNLFGYTGGFSVYAGVGGARKVLTVDQAAPALALAQQHWQMNGLPPSDHQVIAADAFTFLDEATRENKQWGLVILDPPSFASAEADVPGAVNAYTRLIAAGVRVPAPGGILAASSCSSHVGQMQLLELIEAAVSQARRKAVTLGIYGQPPDHPAPLVMPELRYLKFVLMQLD